MNGDPTLFSGKKNASPGFLLKKAIAATQPGRKESVR
jgi:hypothetical protein